MIFDWDKAARLIRERQPTIARAGLSGDWEYTGGTIYKDSLPIKDCSTFLMSTWAIPQLEMDGELEDCYTKNRDCGWDADTTREFLK